jgi:hypothetical protein
MTSINETTTRRQAALPFGRTPLPDLEFALARETVAHIKPPELRRRLSAMLLLARGAGASADDLRYVEGTDVSQVPNSGTWVEIRRPGHERRVPVLVEFSDELRQLARQAHSAALLGERNQPAPLPASVPGHLLELLVARLCHNCPGSLITVERLRRAWLVEHLNGALPLREFLAVTGERSLQAVHELDDFCSPTDMNAVCISRIMGAVSDAEVFDLSAWGLD